MNAFNTIAPIFLVVVLGWVLRRSGFLALEFFQGMNKLTFWVALPVLLFHKIAVATLEDARAWPMFWVLLGGTVAGMALGFVVARLWRMEPHRVASFVQASFRGNLAYVGLPVIIYSIGAPQPGEPDWQTLAVLSIAPLVPIYNIVAVLVLLAGSRERGRVSPWQLVFKALTNPLVVGCAAGFVFWIPGLRLPAFALRTCTTVGQVALPLALFGIGASMDISKIRGQIAPGLVASLVKLVGCPAVGYLLARWAGLGVVETRIILLFLACPTAVISFVMAEQLGGDPVLSSNAVMLSTLLAAIPLSVILMLFV
ncbi:MAG: AEC family transporter [Kiritimatiellae bacterium]|nr:AEC family transporter [Kiritimatiellia bacterium]